MLHRAQLALALILLLALTPLAGANCGIKCVAANPLHPMHAVSAQPCVRASACCHSSGAAVCGAVQGFPGIATLPAAETVTPHTASAFALPSAEPLSRNHRRLAAHSIDSSPPGQLRSAVPTPLRV